MDVGQHAEREESKKTAANWIELFATFEFRKAVQSAADSLNVRNTAGPGVRLRFLRVSFLIKGHQKKADRNKTKRSNKKKNTPILLGDLNLTEASIQGLNIVIIT